MRKISIVTRVSAMFLTASIMYAGIILPRISAAGEESKNADATPTAEQAVRNLGISNVYFEENRGQFNAKAKFFARGTGGYDLFLTDRDAVYVVHEPRQTPRRDLRAEIEEPEDQTPSRATAVYMSLAGANETIASEGVTMLEHRTNYFKGEESNWRTKIPNFSQVRMNGVYDGIDAVWHGRESGGVQYDFVVQPNADPNQIEWNIAGADDVALDGEGNLVISTEFGAIRQNKPFTFQESEGVRVEVASSFVLEPKFAENGAKSFSVKFEVGDYDRTKPLTIDPSVNLSNLSFSTFLGGGAADMVRNVKTDVSGNIYSTGNTFSTGFPIAPGPFQNSYSGNGDAFVTKINPTGNGLIYSTYLGGSADDSGVALAVDSTGNLCVAGTTAGGLPQFPTTVGAFDVTFGGGNYDGFVAKLNPTGSALVFSTLVGGDGADFIRAMDVAADGSVIVTGTTLFFETGIDPFPTTSGAFDTTSNGFIWPDGFVTKFNPSGQALIYSTLIGGTDEDIPTGIDLDSSGNAFVTGYTWTASTPYPTTPGAYDTTHNGAYDVFVSKINPTGSALVYSTLIGGSASDRSFDIKVNLQGEAFITGSAEGGGGVPYPTTPGTIAMVNTTPVAVIVTRVNAEGSGLIYSTFINGSGSNQANSIAIDSFSRAYITGYCSISFPTAGNPYDPSHNGSRDAFLTQIDGGGAAIIYSTFLGGTQNDEGLSVTLDSAGNPIVAGSTPSALYPTNSDSFQPNFGGGGSDGFVTKLGNFVIAGRALDTSGLPIANTAIGASGDCDDFKLTDAQGFFTIGNALANGTCLVSATSSLYNFNPANISVTLDRNKRLTFVGRPVSSGPTVAFGPVGGAVTSTAGNIGLPFTELSIVDVRGNVRTTTTDATGGYRFDNIRLGEMYVIYAERDGFNFEPATAVVNLMTSDLNINFAARPAVSRPVQDFDGDGKTDLAVFRPSEGNWYIEESQTGRLRVVRFGLAGDIPIAEDFDGDRRADITVFRPSNGVWYRLNSTDGGFFAMNFGLTGDVPVPADFDGDGKTDIAVFRPSDGVWHWLNSATGSYSSAQWGMSGDKPFPADFDSDGKADLTVFRSGVWYRLNSSTAQPSIYRFGSSGDIPAAADFDGDGRPDTAVFRPADGTWHWLDNLDGEYHAVQYGLGADKPIPADYNGDGRLEQAVYRNGVWYRLFADGRSTASSFGLAFDIPLSGLR